MLITGPFHLTRLTSREAETIDILELQDRREQIHGSGEEDRR